MIYDNPDLCSYCGRKMTRKGSYSVGIPGVPRVYRCDRGDCKPDYSKPTLASVLLEIKVRLGEVTLAETRAAAALQAGSGVCDTFCGVEQPGSSRGS
jgi:hypothetical protein